MMRGRWLISIASGFIAGGVTWMAFGQPAHPRPDQGVYYSITFVASVASALLSRLSAEIDRRIEQTRREEH